MNRFSILISEWTFLIVLTLFCQNVFADAASDRFNSAKTAFTQAQYEQARTGFEAFLAQYPTHTQATEATYYLAESFLYLKQYAQAENYYNRIVTAGLESAFARAALFRLGDIPYLQGQFAIAKTRLENFVEKLPNDNNLQFVLYYLGDIAMRNNAAEEAEWYFGQCDRMFPTGAKYLENKIGLAWAKNQLGYTSEANNIFQQLMSSSDPAVVEAAIYQWGVTQFERGDFQSASNTLTDFQRRYPTSSYLMDSTRVLARCKGALGDYSGALQLFARITKLTTDDQLVKVRCLYGLKQTQQAQDLLAELERQNDPTYRDEVILLKSVFLFDQQNWQGTIYALESILFPQYNTQTGRMIFNYLSSKTNSSLSSTANQKLSDESFLKACSLLAQAYARSGDRAKANATVQEMQNQATLIGRSDLYAIVTETQNLLAGITSPPNNLPNLSGNHNNPNKGNRPNGNPNSNNSNSGQWSSPGFGTNGTNDQWNPSGETANNGRFGNGSRQPLPTTSGTDIERFNRALQFYQQKNYSATAQQLEQILGTYYNQLTNPKQYTINYMITDAEGSMNEVTFAKACSMLALSKAQLGDLEQANAIFTAFASRVRLTDFVQKNLLQETYDQLAELSKNTGTDIGTTVPSTSLLSESEQRKILRDCNSLYNAKRYDQVDSKLRDLLMKKPEESVEAEAVLLRSKANYKLGKESESIVMLEKVVNDFPSSSQYQEALWYLGIYYDSYGDTVKSVEYFQMLADRFPNSKHIDSALYFLALDDMTNGNGRKANSYLTRIYRNYQAGEHWSHATWMLAYDAYKKNDLAQTEIYLQKLLQHPPDIVLLDRVLYLKGELALRKNEFDTAFVAFREIGKLCPDSPLSEEAARNAHIAAGKSVTATR